MGYINVSDDFGFESRQSKKVKKISVDADVDEIKIEIVNKDLKVEDSVEAVIGRIRVAFYHQLEAKTGWGRNQIKEIFENAINSAYYGETKC